MTLILANEKELEVELVSESYDPNGNPQRCIFIKSQAIKSFDEGIEIFENNTSSITVVNDDGSKDVYEGYKFSGANLNNNGGRKTFEARLINMI